MPREEAAIKKLMEAADKDPELRAKLLKEPQAVGKQWAVSFTEAEVTQLKIVGRLTELVAEFTAGRVIGPGPITYPIDIWWKGALSEHILHYRPIYYPLFHHIFYPVGPIFYPRFGPIGYPGPWITRLPGVIKK